LRLAFHRQRAEQVERVTAALDGARDECDLGVVAHIQHVISHRGSDLADLGGVRRRQHRETLCCDRYRDV